jgi:hypothetical protein
MVRLTVSLQYSGVGKRPIIQHLEDTAPTEEECREQVENNVQMYIDLGYYLAKEEVLSLELDVE